jgi:hypothetical protein
MSAETERTSRSHLEQLFHPTSLDTSDDPYMIKSYQGMKNVSHVPELPLPLTDASRNR